MNGDGQPNKSWLTQLLDEGEKIIPASALGIIGVISFVAVFWLLTTTQGQNILTRFIPRVIEVELAETREIKYKQALRAALEDGTAEPLTENEKRAAIKSLAERIDAGEQGIATVDEKEKILMSLQQAQ